MEGRVVAGAREPAGPAAGTLYEPRRILRNFSAAVAGEGISRGAAFLATLVVARSVSSGDFGRFSFVLALVSVGLLASDVGLQVVATRSIAADRRRAAEYLTGALLIGGAFGAAGYVLLAGAGFLGLLPAGVAAPIAIFAAALLLAAVINPYWSLLRAFERQDLVYATYSLSSLVLLAGVIYAATLDASVELLFAVYVASFVVRLVSTLAVSRRTIGRIGWSAKRSTTRALLVAVPGTAFAYFLLGVYSHVDVVLLGYLVPVEDVGAYAAAYRLVDAVTFLTAGALTAAVFPVFARLAKEAPEAVTPLYNRTTRIMVAGLAPVSIALAAFAYPIVDFVYDFDSDEAGRVFMLLAPSSLLISLNFATAFLALAVGGTRVAIASTGLAAVVNVTTIFVGVPLFGVAAAAVATLVAEIAMLVAFHALLTRTGFETRTLGTAAVAALLVAVPFLLILAFPAERAWVGVGGAAVAVVAVRATGLVTGDDVRAVRRAVRR